MNCHRALSVFCPLETDVILEIFAYDFKYAVIFVWKRLCLDRLVVLLWRKQLAEFFFQLSYRKLFLDDKVA